VKFGFLSEGDTPDGLSHYHRYHEVLEEMELADALGFDFCGTSEQHFFPSVATFSAPETFYAAIAARTSRIKLRHMSVLTLAFNHPVRVAERLATLDIISHGRVELCTARSNSPRTLDAFGINPNETRAQWREGLEATVRALTEDPFEFKGKYYNVPSRSVVPRLYRKEMFPVSVIATSLETFTLAGKSGLGAMTNDNYGGWDYLERGAKAYKEAIKDAQPFAPYPVNDSLGFCIFIANCDSDVERAYRTGRHVAEGFCAVCYDVYMPLVKRSESYRDFAQIQDVYDHRRDLDYMMDKTPSVVLGKPEKFIETIERLQALGFNEVCLRNDGFGHEQNMRSLEMFGKYVIPHFKAPSGVVQSEYRTELGVKDVPQYLL
jgi:alkanesulfonate monooxygenase SsuD/methylene tetrahydromethanopterin reductase-like flavin-dependent oxidoreductase (luciferase family)